MEDAEAALNAFGIKQAAYKRVRESEQKINQFPKKIIYESEKDKIESKIKELKKEKENINAGGLLGRITGKHKKAKTKKRELEKKIAAEKAKLNKLDKKINKLEKLKKERLEYFDYIDAADIKLKELKNKTKESKIKNINKKRERHRTR
jgi:pyruvate/2-oxoacid:ferredoxin oxidoreductase alpha subunit